MKVTTIIEKNRRGSLTPAHANENVILNILTNAGELDLNWHTDLAQDLLPAETRQLQHLWRLQDPTETSTLNRAVLSYCNHAHPVHISTSFRAATVKVFPLGS